MLNRASVPLESSWLSKDDRAEGELALGALTALRKTFSHWMVLARFLYKLQVIAEQRAQNAKRNKNSFRILLEINGFDRDTVEQNLGGEKGGWSTISRLIKIGKYADEVQAWYDNEKPDMLKVAAPTTIIKHCPEIPKADRGPAQPSKSHRDVKISEAKKFAEAEAEAKRLKRENEQLSERNAEMEEELTGVRGALGDAVSKRKHAAFDEYTSTYDAYRTLCSAWIEHQDRIRDLRSLISATVLPVDLEDFIALLEECQATGHTYVVVVHGPMNSDGNHQLWARCYKSKREADKSRQSGEGVKTLNSFLKELKAQAADEADERADAAPARPETEQDEAKDENTAAKPKANDDASEAKAKVALH
jgi:hypothetical protein